MPGCVIAHVEHGLISEEGVDWLRAAREAMAYPVINASSWSLSDRSSDAFNVPIVGPDTHEGGPNVSA